MSRSQPSYSEAPDAASDPFFKDLEKAINLIVNVAARARLGDNYEWVTFARHPDLGKYICWCGIEEEHGFQTCSERPNLKLQNLPTVKPGARISRCTHTHSQLGVDHNCFCFQVDPTVKLFNQFFLSKRTGTVLSPGHTFSEGDPANELDSEEKRAIQKIVTISNGRIPKSQQLVSDGAKCKVLTRFVTDMRRDEIVSEANKECLISWNIERIHAILRWNMRTIDDCVAELKVAMERASRHRASPNKSVAELITEGDITFDGSYAYYE
jgi:hypothetical protein